MAAETHTQSFWEHLDVLRAAIFRIVAVAVVFGIAAFFFKEELFAVVLAPKDDGFVTYRLLDRMAAWAGSAVEPFSVRLINTGLAQQFIIHMKTALCAGVLCASPYILYQLFRFVSPALYDNERRYVMRMVGGGYAMFGLGVLISYFLIFPLTFRFLGTYQVSGEVDNLISRFVYFDAGDDVPCNGHRLRDTDTLVVVCKVRFSFCGFHAPLSETRYCDYPCGRRDYYAYVGRLHAFAGCITDVGVV